MNDTALTYGNGLYELAVSEKLTEEILSDVNAVKLLLKENPDYIKLLNEPSVSKDERKKLLDQAFSGKIQMYLLNFLKILTDNGQMNEFSACADAYRRRYNMDHNISEAIVTSAVKLNDVQINALKEKLEKLTGRTVIILEKVDERYIAGIRVEIDGKQYDGTVSGRLDSIKKKVTDIIV